MRFLICALWTVTALLLAASIVSADMLSVAADLPVSYSFSDNGLGGESVSGAKLAVSFPFLLGLGLESYSVSGNKASDTFDYKVTMYDVFLDIPFPILNFVIGGGVGRGNYSDTSGVPYSEADLSQWFLSIGYPFALIFDVHLAYHSIGGRAQSLPPITQNLNAQMVTLGVKVGF